VLSRRVHSRYQRRLGDAAAGGQEVLIHLQVRRFFCGNQGCAKVTFAEQVPGLTTRCGRRTSGLDQMLQAIALALGGRPGSRLAGRLACAVSRSTLLRLIRALPDPQTGQVTVLGVDDFALRRGHVYGTVPIDIQARRPVDMLPERSAESFRSWLEARPGVEVICRDRGGCYAEGAALGAPTAIQVADRWHLWHNLAGAVERAVARHRPRLQDEPAEPGPPDPPAEPAAPGALAIRTRARHDAIHAALGRGLSAAEISRVLQLDRKTVRRYAAAATPGEVSGGARAERASLLDPHLPYLHARWEEGCGSTDRLHQEIRARGYRGNLRRHTAQLRQATALPAPPSVPASKTVARWILTPPGNLADADRAALAQITARFPELTATCALVRGFAGMLCHRRGRHLEAWVGRAEASSVPELRGFAAGLRKDWAAVTAGLTLPYSSGAVEGHVNRIKMIKRQMYGRAKPDLLRKRVLLAD
jgi:transposase